jgi:hypothetical protein
MEWSPVQLDYFVQKKKCCVNLFVYKTVWASRMSLVWMVTVEKKLCLKNVFKNTVFE